MIKIGLTVDALQIQSIDDGSLGYILAMSAPHNAAIQQQAQIAQAKANQAAAEAEQESQRNQAEFARQTAIVQAQYKAEVDKAQAEASQAGPLAEAQAQREVLAMRTELAQRAAELRQQELVSEVVKPAEAEAERVRILAVADAEKMKIQAEAAASHNRVALDRMLIDQLPEIVKQAAHGLSGANLTVLNGADGLGEMATGLVGQGLAIFDSLRGGLGQHPTRPLRRGLLEGHRGKGLAAAGDDRVRPRPVVAKRDLDQPVAIEDGHADMVAVGPAFGERPLGDGLRQVERQRLFADHIAAGATAAAGIGRNGRRRQTCD